MVAALIAATVVLALPRETDSEGVVDGAAFSYEGPIRYSLEAEKEFKGYISRFLETVLAGFIRLTFQDFEFDDDNLPVEINNSSAVSDPLITLYANAGIPAEKLISLGKVLAGFSVDEVADAEMDTILFFLDFGEYNEGDTGTIATASYCSVCETIVDTRETEDEKCPVCGAPTEKKKFVLGYASPEQLALRAGALDFGAVYSDFVGATMLTKEEGARIVYELIYMLQDEAGKKIVSAMGRTRFSNLVVSAAALTESYYGFRSGGGSLIEARATAALAYELGDMLKKVASEVGADTLLETFGLTGAEMTDEMMNYLEENGINTDELADFESMNAALREADKVAHFLLYSMTETLLSTDTPLFDALYYEFNAETEAEREDYGDLFAVLAAKCVAAGLKTAYSETALTDASAAAQAFADVFEKIAALEENAAASVGREELEKLFNDVESVAERFSDIRDVGGIRALDASERARIREFADYVESLTAEGKIRIPGADTFASTIFANLTFRLFATALETVGIK